MINDGRLLATIDSQKVFSRRLGEGIGAQSHVFRESQNAHLTPQNQTQEGHYCPRASRHHWKTLSKITHKDNHFTAKGQIWVLHDVPQNPVYYISTMSVLCWSLIPNDQLCFLEQLNRITMPRYRAH
jgi:hypothetical protein